VQIFSKLTLLLKHDRLVICRLRALTRSAHVKMELGQAVMAPASTKVLHSIKVMAAAAAMAPALTLFCKGPIC